MEFKNGTYKQYDKVVKKDVGVKLEPLVDKSLGFNIIGEKEILLLLAVLLDQIDRDGPALVQSEVIVHDTGDIVLGIDLYQKRRRCWGKKIEKKMHKN